MADEIMTDEGMPLSIVVDVETEDARRKLAAWNREVASMADKSEKYEKLLQIHALAKTKVETASGIGASARKRDYRAIETEIARILTSALSSTATRAASATTTRSTMPTTSEIAEGREIAERREPTDFELGDADKKVLDAKGITEWTSSIREGVKTVEKTLTSFDGEVYDLSTTISRVKGTLVESGEIKGQPVLTTTESDKTRIRTQELADGFKTIREYIGLSNGELYLMAEKVSKVEEKTKKLPHSLKEVGSILGNMVSKNVEKGFKGITSGKLFKRIGSIITYRIARSIMSGITNGAKQGFSLLSQDNEALSNIMSQFDEIKTTLQVSFAAVLIPIAEALATALEPIANELLDFANAMSLANAQAKGESQYYKLSSDSIKEYAKSLKQANQQLSQLDKFATLSGSNSAKLGTWESVDDLLPEDEDIAEKYKTTTDFFLNLSDTIKDVMKSIGEVFVWFGENIKTIITLAGLLISAVNPIAGAIIGFGAAALGTSTEAKILGSSMLALAGGFIGVGIAKAFAANPFYGAAVGVAAGAMVGVITSIASSLGTSGSVNTNTSSGTDLSSLSETSSLYSTSDLYAGIEASTSKGVSSSNMTVKGDVYIDGQKAGRVMENYVYTEGKRVGHF